MAFTQARLKIKNITMKKFKLRFVEFTSYFFILLFCYAAISKILDFENFQIQIGQSPLLSAFAGFISYTVIIIELTIVIALVFTKSRLRGLYWSSALMSGFTVYIFLILNFSDFVPCSCGGILEKLGWTEHLIFNIGCVILGLVSVWIKEKERRTSSLKTAIWLSIYNITAILLIIILFYQSEYIIKKENNFTRRFLMYPIIEDGSIDLDSKYYYFAGEDLEHIYLGNKQYPQILTKVSKNFQSTSSIKINLDNIKYPFKSLIVIVHPPYYYLADGTVPIIYRGKLGTSDAKTISFQDAFFSQIVAKDSSSFILRTFNSHNNNLTIASLSVQDSPKVKLYSGLIQKQKDGVFDSDGQLTFVNNPFRIIYLYNYRNEFFVADESLKIRQRLNTIDTIHTAKVQSKKLSDGRHKMVAPPLQVNQKISVQGKLAFVQSALIGRNESVSTWKKAKVVDIYLTDKKYYLGSFYIYDQGNNKMTDYMAGSSNFYAFIGQKLVKYSYRKPVLQHLKPGEAENLH